MANTTVGASVQVEFASIGQMRKAIKEATSDLVVMQEQFGKTSPQAIAAAKRIAELKDKIQDAKEQADLFDPGKRFSAFANAANQVAAGFSAVQGALALAGTESKDLEKTLVKVQGAVALSQGLSQLKDLGKAYDELKVVAVDAFSSTRKALASVGIGALAIALTAIIANWDKFRDSVYKLIPGLETVAKFIGNLVTSFTDFVGITSEAERNLDKFTKANAKAREVIQGQIKLLEAQGGQEEKVYKLKKDNIESELNDLRAAAKVKGKISEEDQKKIRDFLLEQKVLDIEESNRKKKLAEDDAKELAEKQKKLNEEKKAFEKQFTDFIISENDRRKKLRLDDFSKEAFDIDKKYADLIAKAKKYNLDTKEIESLRFQEGKDLVNKTTEENKAGLDKQLSNFTAMVPKMATMQTTLTTNQATESGIRKRIDEQELESKRQMADQTASILNGLSDLFGKQTAAGKAAAIAAIVVEQAASISRIISNTAAANAKSVAASPLTGGMPWVALNTVSAAVSIASSIANARKSIQQINSNSQNVSGGGAPVSMAGGGAAPVSAQPTATVTAQALNAQAINQLSNQSARAYILNSDIQNNEQRNAYLQRNARLG